MIKRRIITAALLASPWLALATAPGQTAPEVKPAAMAWLKMLDTGDHGASWQAAAAPFKGAVTAVQWQQAAQGVRSPLGAVRERKDKATTFTRTLPGAPDGQYAVLQFDTTFENKAQAVETLTAVLEADGVWRVTGYFIR